MSDLVILDGYRDWIAMDKRRMASKEIDYGLYWTRTGSEREFPRWRVSWIETTGELYAAQPTKDRFILLGTIPLRDRLDVLMEGWAESGSEIYHNLKALARRMVAREPA